MDHYEWFNPFEVLAHRDQLRKELPYAEENGRNFVVQHLADGEKSKFHRALMYGIERASFEAAREMVGEARRSLPDAIMHQKQVAAQIEALSLQIIAPAISVGKLEPFVTMPCFGEDLPEIRVRVATVAPFQYVVSIPPKDYL